MYNYHAFTGFQTLSQACVHILNKITGNIPTTTFHSQYVHLTNITLADTSFQQSSPIHILLGAQHVWRVLTFAKLLDKRGEALAISSIFGWIITAFNNNMVSGAISCLQ